MNMTTMLFLRSDPAMYTSPGHTYARVGVRDPARMYVRGRIYFLAPWPPYVRVHATCAPLHRPVCTHTFATRMTTLRTLRPGGSRLSGTPCLRRCSWWVPAVRGANCFVFFCPDALPCVRRCSCWVPAVRGRIVFFARTHFLACEGVAGGSQQSGGNVFLRNTVTRTVGPCCQVEESLFSA